MKTQDLEKTLEVPSKKLVTLQLDTEVKHCLDCGFYSCLCKYQEEVKKLKAEGKWPH